MGGLAGCCCVLCCFIVFVAVCILTPLVIVGYTDLTPVDITVDEASLGRLALATSPAGNGTATAFFLSYNFPLAVAVRNPSWAVRAWRTAPLDAELRFHGHPFTTVRLGTAAERSQIRALRTEVLRVVAAAERAPVEELSGFEVAEFARERVAGEFQLGLIVSGECKYQAHSGRRSIRVSCPLRLSLLPTSKAAAAAFERVSCTD